MTINKPDEDRELRAARVRGLQQEDDLLGSRRIDDLAVVLRDRCPPYGVLAHPSPLDGEVECTVAGSRGSADGGRFERPAHVRSAPIVALMPGPILVWPPRPTQGDGGRPDPAHRRRACGSGATPHRGRRGCPPGSPARGAPARRSRSCRPAGGCDPWVSSWIQPWPIGKVIGKAQSKIF